MCDYWKRKEQAMLHLEQIIQAQYDIINKELFDGKLKPIEITVEWQFIIPHKPTSFAQLRIPKNEPHYIAFNFSAHDEARENYVIETYDFYDETISEEELEGLLKEEIAGTLIHEMIHQYGIENNVPDTVFDAEGIDQHTEMFKEIAEEKGLFVLQADNGWSKTHINPLHPILDKLPFEDVLKDIDSITEIISALESSDI